MTRFKIDPDEARFLGIPIKTVAFEDVPPFVPETYRVGPGISCLRAIKADVLGGLTLCAVCVQNEGFVDVVILTGEGFQVDPPSYGHAHKTDTREKAAEMLMEELMVPLLARLADYPQDKFDAFLSASRTKWEAIKAAAK